MKKSLLLIFSLAALFSVLSSCQKKKPQEKTGVNTVTEETFLFKHGHQQNESHPRTKTMLWFEKELESRSNGRIEVEIYHSAVLGNEKNMFEMLVTNNIQGFIGAYYEQLNPEFLIYNLPFLFRNSDEMRAFSESDFAQKMNEKGSIKGVYIPATGFTPFRNLLTNNKAVSTPEDLKGLTVRVPGQAPVIEFYRLLGANPTEVPMEELYMAAKTKVVNAADNAAPNLYDSKIHEVLPHYVNLNYMAGAQPFTVSMPFYQSLPEDLKALFDKTAREAVAMNNRLYAEEEARYHQLLVDNTQGLSTMDPQNIELFKEITNPLRQTMVDDGYVTWADIETAEKFLDDYRAGN